jgi:hypothetical protein
MLKKSSILHIFLKKYSDNKIFDQPRLCGLTIKFVT